MRILVIDDDKDIREFLKASLTAESFAVDTAGDGEEGSYMARVHEYDLIILDNIMPRKNGAEVCKNIRSIGKSTPIIILSVQSETDDKINLLNIGADDYITKPFSYKELRSRIYAILRRPPTVTSPILKVDDLALDIMNQKAIRGKREIYLTRKEFALTEFLMRNASKTVSRGKLMEHVWNDRIDPFSNTLEAHILNLRKKIDKTSKNKLIHTIPGRGYKIGTSNSTIFT